MTDCAPARFSADTVNEYVPAVVGVPDTAPDAVFRLNFFGGAPALTPKWGVTGQLDNGRVLRSGRTVRQSRGRDLRRDVAGGINSGAIDTV